MDFISNYDFQQGLEFLGRMLAAFLIALPVGFDREKTHPRAGLRTFPLVAVASTSIMMLGKLLADGNADAEARVLQGLVMGVGFLGGGAILKGDGEVRGTSTAAAIWGTAACGAALAYDLYMMAVALMVVTFATLRWLAPLKEIAQNEEHERKDGAQPPSGERDNDPVKIANG